MPAIQLVLKEGYEITSRQASDVLLIGPAIIDLDVTAGNRALLWRWIGYVDGQFSRSTMRNNVGRGVECT